MTIEKAYQKCCFPSLTGDETSEPERPEIEAKNRELRVPRRSIDIDRWRTGIELMGFDELG